MAELNCKDSRDNSRRSHVTFIENRDWRTVSLYWRDVVNLRREIDSDTNLSFKVTDLEFISELGKEEYCSTDPRYKRKTFALRVGYDGSQYSGYQSQNKSNVLTVEDDIRKCLAGRSCVAAGRTDTGVSAISQILSFTTYDDIDAASILKAFDESSDDPSRYRRVRAYECVRVPRRFHSLFSATWRRYVYLFPLNSGPFTSRQVDVDVDFANAILNKYVVFFVFKFNLIFLYSRIKSQKLHKYILLPFQYIYSFNQRSFVLLLAFT